MANTRAHIQWIRQQHTFEFVKKRKTKFISIEMTHIADRHQRGVVNESLSMQ